MIQIENENWERALEEILWVIPKEHRKEMIERALVAIEKPKFTRRKRTIRSLGMVRTA